MQIATGGKTQVVPREPQVLTHLTFSPDGEYLYFARGAPNRGGFVLSRVPAIGGLETPILDDVDTPVSFSPDGRQFVFMRGAGPESQIVVAAAKAASTNSGVAKGPAHVLVRRAGLVARRQGGGRVRDRSEQGLAVVHRSSPGRRRQQPRTLHERQSHRPRPLAARRIGTADGRLGSAGEAIRTMAGGRLRLSGGSIWRIGYPGGRAERLTSDLADHDLCCLDIGANSSVVASVINSLVSDLWIAPTDHLDAPRQITGVILLSCVTAG